MSLSNTGRRRGGEDAYLHSFLSLALDGGECSKFLSLAIDGGECSKSHPGLLTRRTNPGNV